MILKDKIALITGAGQGIGQGIALAMVNEGARIAVTGRTLEKLEQTCDLIRERGGEAIAVQCDVKDQPSLEACVKTVVDKFGTIDILVNNAQEVPLGEGDVGMENYLRTLDALGYTGPLTIEREIAQIASQLFS